MKAWVASVSALLAVGCATRPPPPPPPALGCAAPCAAIREVKFPRTVVIDVVTAPGSRLKNAAVASASQAGCQSGVPVHSVHVDEVPYDEGPASLSGQQALKLVFPFVAENDAPDAGLTPPVSLDLDMRTPGGDRCLRVPLPPRPPGVGGFLSELSYRVEKRR